MIKSTALDLFQLINDLDCSKEVKQDLMQQINNVSGSTDEVLMKPHSSIEEKLKEENIKLKEELSHFEKQLDFIQMLFANVAHEIRTPLHGIIGMVHLMKKTPMNTNQREYTNVTKSSAENLLVIVNDLLLLSKANAGKVQLNNKAFPIRQFLSEMESMLKFKAEEKGLQLSFHVPDNLPEHLIGDRTRLYQILLNLLNNALKFTNQGYIKLSVEILNQDNNDVQLRFIIKDTGIGIKKEKLSQLFKSFSRVHDENKEVIEGAGLGLNIVKRLLALLNGTVKVESEFYQGTTFTVEIPFGICTNQCNNSNKNTITIPMEWKTKKFLMIEDNHANVLYSKEIFEDWGLNLCVAKDLAEAAVKLKNPYDCILCDVKLPDGNGLDFISDLRNDNQAINQNTPSIVLTASTNEDGVVQFDKKFIQSYLSKPFPPEELLRELKKIIPVKYPEQTYQPKTKNPIIDISENQLLEDSTNDFKESLSKRFKSRTNLMIEMIKIFLDQSPVMLRVLSEAPGQNNYEELRFEAHKFKSTVNIIGLKELKNYASKVELAYSDGKPKECTKTLIHDFITQLKLDDQIVRTVLKEITVQSN